MQETEGTPLDIECQIRNNLFVVYMQECIQQSGS